MLITLSYLVQESLSLSENSQTLLSTLHLALDIMTMYNSLIHSAQSLPGLKSLNLPGDKVSAKQSKERR